MPAKGIGEIDTNRNYNNKWLFVSLFLILFAGAPAYSLELSVSTNGVVMSEHLGLGDSTSFKGLTVLSDGNIFHDHVAEGSGDNSIKDTIRGNSYATTNTVASNGRFSTSVSAAASSNSAIYGQSTKAEGDAGYIGTDAISNNNNMHVATGFVGSGGNLNVHLLTGADKSAASIGGDANVNNIEFYNDEISKVIMSGDLGRSVDGIYETKEGNLGKFGFNSVNAITQTSGPYTLTGYKWNTRNPNLKLYLRDDNLPKGVTVDGAEGTINAAKAIKNAAALWDSKTRQNLFSPQTVTVSDAYDISPNAPDYKNVHAFKLITKSNGDTDKNTIGYALTWYTRSRIGVYHSALDSDIVYNNYFDWSGTSAQSVDLQTIACHELGHTLGLADLYNSGPAYQAQMMYGYYTGPKSSLGGGDIAGLQRLYGV